MKIIPIWRISLGVVIFAGIIDCDHNAKNSPAAGSATGIDHVQPLRAPTPPQLQSAHSDMPTAGERPEVSPEIRDFYESFRKAVIRDDREYVANQIRYPISIDLDGKSSATTIVTDPRTFVSAYDRIMLAGIKKAIKKYRAAPVDEVWARGLVPWADTHLSRLRTPSRRRSV